MRRLTRARGRTGSTGRLRAIAAAALGCLALGLLAAAPAAASPAWLAPAGLSAAGQNAGGPQVAVDAQGDATAVWERSNGTNTIVQSATRPAGGAWSAPSGLSAAGQNAYEPQVAVDPQGDATAVWERYDGANYIVQAAGYDAAGPQLRGLSIPAAGSVGQPVSFSVSPLDVWSSLGGTGWSFGDGGSAVGTSVTHTYASAGSYQVTLTSADALGNTSSAAGTIAIARYCAFAGRAARVKGGKALLKLKGRGAARCRGVVKLTYRQKAKRVLLGKSKFRIAAGETKIVPVKLSPKGKALLRKAGKGGLKVQLTGTGVKHRTVLLKAPPRHHRRRG